MDAATYLTLAGEDGLLPDVDLSREQWVEFGLETLLRLGSAALILLAAYGLARWARRGVQGWVSRSTARTLARGGDAREMRAELRAETLGAVMAQTAAILVWTIAFITALGQLGVQLAPLIAGAGIAGLAIGFGAQQLVRDFFAGFFILLEDQYGVGDAIVVNPEAAGTVEEVSLRVTRLRSLDGTVWFVPNGEIRQIGNRSKEWARALVDIEVAYGEDIDEVGAIILQVSAKLRRDPEMSSKILEDVEILGVEMFGESGITIRTYIKTLPLEQFLVSRRFRQELKAAFDELGIEIPFPHRKLIFADDERSKGARRALGSSRSPRRSSEGD